MSTADTRRGDPAFSEVEKLASVLSDRLGKHSDGRELALAYMCAVQWNAIARTLGPGPVATSFAADRISLLMDVSKELGRLLSDIEIGALMRVTMSNARRWHRELLAVYADEANPLALNWSLAGARLCGRGKENGVVGNKVAVSNKEKIATLVHQIGRLGFDAVVLHGEPKEPHLVLISDAFDLGPYLPGKKGR